MALQLKARSMANPVRLPLRGKIALVTGASQGIGKALARGFAAAGAFVWVHGRDSKGEEFAREIGGAFVKADLEAEADVTMLTWTILARGDPLHILINNAGLFAATRLEGIDLAEMDRIWKVNIRAPTQLIRDLLPALRKARGASVINVTSIHEQVPHPHSAAYNMSKAALAMLTKTAAVELGPLEIRVNNLAPGAVETDINRALIERIGRRQFNEWIPAGRVGSTEDMIGPAVFLASDASRYVTGATLFADGGYRLNLIRYRPEEHHG
jgi:NAD(P)-dependent dehydrogenase (short-subunit alcohol dehydrogenase family)